jgi:hypothetical protein
VLEVRRRPGRCAALRAAPGGGTPGAAGRRTGGRAATLREALELWRGPALAEFADEPFAAPEIARLEGLRLEAIEERIEAELQLGRHRELAAELEGLASEHPFRERLCAQLMLALYRSGRQAEALTAYRVARSVYVEELGIEPTPALAGAGAGDPATGCVARRGRAAACGPAERQGTPVGERKLATILVAAPTGCPEDG